MSKIVNIDGREHRYTWLCGHCKVLVSALSNEKVAKCPGCGKKENTSDLMEEYRSRMSPNGIA